MTSLNCLKHLLNFSVSHYHHHHPCPAVFSSATWKETQVFQLFQLQVECEVLSEPRQMSWKYCVVNSHYTTIAANDTLVITLKTNYWKNYMKIGRKKVWFKSWFLLLIQSTCRFKLWFKSNIDLNCDLNRISTLFYFQFFFKFKNIAVVRQTLVR